MNAETKTVATPPSVLWAQGNGQVFLTFNVECEEPDVQIKDKLVVFKGTGMPEQKLYEVEIPLYAEIDPDKSKYINKGRYIEVVLTKDKQDDAFWPYLTSDKKKHHWLKVDFDRWQDEDESDVSDNMFDDDTADIPLKNDFDEELNPLELDKLSCSE